MKSRWSRKAIKSAICNEVDFKLTMEEIKHLSEECHKYLFNSDPRTWSRHGFGLQFKTNILLNNICKSFNARVLPTREKSILSMFEWIRRSLMKRFVIKRQGVLAYTRKFTPKATKSLLDWL